MLKNGAYFTWIFWDFRNESLFNIGVIEESFPLFLYFIIYINNSFNGMSI